MIKAAEDLCNKGYELLSNNCLDAVYNNFIAYSVTGSLPVTLSNYWCCSQISDFSFFGALTDGWLLPI
jgi:hypothetical protein